MKVNFFPYFSPFCSKKDQFTIVPILVGSLNSESEAKFGKLLSKYLIRPENLFVVSSDFCHWGKFPSLYCAQRQSSLHDWTMIQVATILAAHHGKLNNILATKVAVEVVNLSTSVCLG